jgi:hypothetical protein
VVSSKDHRSVNRNILFPHHLQECNTDTDEACREIYSCSHISPIEFVITSIDEKKIDKMDLKKILVEK